MTTAIILCSGNSTRMQSEENKVFIEILRKPLLYYAIKNFEDSDLIENIILVAKKGEFGKTNSIIKKYNFKKIKNIIEGGKERQDSAYNGLKAIENPDPEDIILFHNGCNPFVKEEEIKNIIIEAEKNDAAVLAFPLKDTIKKVNKENFIESAIDRNNVWQMQTPQAIKYELALEAFEKSKKDNYYGTDDISLVERLGKKIKIVPCSYENIKITAKDDLSIAEGILMKENRVSGMDFRVGFGQDSHAFSKDKNKELLLGGYIIEDEMGLEADSDGDVILHALFNAISTSQGERSLGYYADEMCKKGITDSREYLKVILSKLEEKNMILNNVSIMIEAAKPKLERYTEKIKDSLSKILGLEKNRIGLSYTSGDNLTTFGQGKGMQCFAIVTLKGN